ncbi:FAD-dependent oxidoreductase, partial [Candidatus Margulisiibacteriota bacterium]
MKLFEPIIIGQLKIKNRIVMPAMDLAWSKDGLINDKIIKFYEARARGGVGLITIGGAFPSKEAVLMPDMLFAYLDECIPHFKRLNHALHSFGAKTSLQLLHPGRYAHPALNNRKQPVSSSAVASDLLPGNIPHKLSIDEIKQIVADYAQAAKRAREGGFDAVELHGSSGYLISQFISPAVNQRTDEYGGSPEKRLRFVFEIIKAIKNIAGKGFPIIIRLPGEDLVKSGYHMSDYLSIAKELQEEIAAISIAPFWNESKSNALFIGIPDGSFTYLSAEFKKATSIPIITGARLRDVKSVEEILISGQADMIFWGRALIADPELPNKIEQGKADQVLPCVSCNTCFDEVAAFRPLLCMLNPVVGKEGEVEINRAEKFKKVIVIGGGPAGIQAALTASERGHAVTLFEKEDRLGGCLKLCYLPEDRSEIEKALVYFQNQLNNSNVKVVLGEKLDTQKILDLKPDSIVVATGSEPIIPGITGITRIEGRSRDNLVTAEYLLKNKVLPGKNVVVIGGGLVGSEVALTIKKMGAMSPESAVFLLQHEIITGEQAKKYTLAGNRDVTIVEKMSKIGRGFGKSNRWMVLKSLQMSGVNVLANSEVKEIQDGQVLVVTGKEKKEVAIPADTVVISVGYRSNKSGFEELEGKVKELYFIGDAVNPRKLKE